MLCYLVFEIILKSASKVGKHLDTGLVHLQAQYYHHCSIRDYFQKIFMVCLFVLLGPGQGDRNESLGLLGEGCLALKEVPP